MVAAANIDRLHPSQAALVNAVHGEFDRAQAMLADRLAGMPAGQRDIQIAQNVLRTCLEAVLVKVLPYDHTTLAELAIRMASYAVSAAPIDDQETLMAVVVQTLPEAHRRRVAQGVMISTTWQIGGDR